MYENKEKKDLKLIAKAGLKSLQKEDDTRNLEFTRKDRLTIP